MDIIDTEEKPQSYFFFQLFTIITTFSSVPIVLFVFLQEPREKPESYPAFYAEFFSYFYCFLFFLWTWAYFTTCASGQTKIKNAMIGFSGGHCEKCKITKPDRAHHCSACGTCIAKMDHHCVWTNTCVGYYNYKTFLLFVGYLSLGTYTYDYLSYEYIVAPDKFNLWIALKILVYLETAIVYITTFLATALFSTHILMALINLTTIEYIKGKPFIYPFCYSEIDAAANQHHLGPAVNWLEIFGKNPLFWPIPIQHKGKEDGQFFPTVPLPNEEDYINFEKFF
ncbi:unnamed protein product [Blepharisma stoltei]|uniref:Palmitoyltransferase n=1 Tax=Blepharisma stoltei TaxID=1481888 RepID=A0AAU9IHT2_9CILI|nr:unnamed protein product [Blepharisma stoltei]